MNPRETTAELIRRIKIAKKEAEKIIVIPRRQPTLEELLAKLA